MFVWMPSHAEAALSGALDSEGYFPNVRVRCQDLAHAIRRQVVV